MDNNHTLPKSERLCSKREIDSLFAASSSFVVYPYRIIYRKSPLGEGEAPASIFVSVPKKKFKRAVMRNLLRRRTKEAYRLHKSPLLAQLQEADNHLSIAILYLDKEEKPYAYLERKMVELLARLQNELLPPPPATEATNDIEP